MKSPQPDPSDSRQWNFDHVYFQTLMDDMRTVWGNCGTEVLKNIAELFKWESKLVGQFGHIAIQTTALLWKDIRDELETLQLANDSTKWGDKTKKRVILKKYRMTEWKFDHNQAEREQLIFFLECQKAKLENMIIKLSHEFQIEIPVKPPDWFTKEPWLYPKDMFDKKNLPES
jgi:hypothetical protein